MSQSREQSQEDGVATLETKAPKTREVFHRPLTQGDKGDDVRALQHALNARARARRHPGVAPDGVLGGATWRAWEDLGYSLGLRADTLDADAIPVGAQQLIAHPKARNAHQLERARMRAPHLAQRTIAMDGTPVFWGLAAPLVEARSHGWRGALLSADRRAGVAERFGKKSQAKLFSCAQAKQQRGFCPASCGGDCLPANPPGRSSHELCSDGFAFAGPVGRALPWFCLGLDVSDSEQLLSILTRLGYGVRRPYHTASELHHLNFTRDPGPVLPPVHVHPAAPSVPPRRVPRSIVTLTGPDVSQFQGDVDWREVRHTGHSFAFAKATEGKDFRDPWFSRARWSAMRAAGLRRGAYHFARAQQGRPPELEAHHFLQTVHAVGWFAKGDLPPVLDLEWVHGLSPAHLHAWVAGWVKTVHRETGVRPLIYTGGPFWNGAVGASADALGCPLWLAAYVSNPRPFIPAAWHHAGMTLWQFTDRARCPGVKGPCDMSRFRGDPAAFRRLGF
jgi:GH25 family lysozyme M1 (1,4-beta-N-acetylmuramidase)